MYVVNEDGEVRRDNRQTVTWLVLLAVAILFGMLFVITIAVMDGREVRVPQAANIIFWVSTFDLLLISGAMIWHTRAPGNPARQQTVLISTFFMGLVFTGLQTFGFFELWAVIDNPETSAPGLLQVFFVMLALHALHVLGGLILLYRTMMKSLAGTYNAENHKGMRLMEPYWHLLTAIWIVFFILL